MSDKKCCTIIVVGQVLRLFIDFLSIFSAPGKKTWASVCGKQFKEVITGFIKVTQVEKVLELLGGLNY